MTWTDEQLGNLSARVTDLESRIVGSVDEQCQDRAGLEQRFEALSVSVHELSQLLEALAERFDEERPRAEAIGGHVAKWITMDLVGREQLRDLVTRSYFNAEIVKLDLATKNRLTVYDGLEARIARVERRVRSLARTVKDRPRSRLRAAFDALRGLP
jgi:hypothetical protein